MEYNWVELLKDYNIYDFITRISVLNLLPQNQNKDFVFDEIIDGILQNDKKNYSGTNIISKNKFASIVNNVFSSDSMLLDPIEYPFIQRVQFYGDRWIFNGRNNDCGYRLQMFINALFLHKNDFEDSFVNTVSLMLELLLSISNKIAENLGYGMDSLQSYNERSIVFPDLKTTEKLLTCNTFKINDYMPIVGEKYFKDIFIGFCCKASKSSEDYDFYHHPFLKISNEEFICLNPTMIPTFAISFILKLSISYKILDNLISAYNSAVWEDCLSSFKQLNHKKIKEVSIGIQLINESGYKEALLNAANDGLWLVILASDDGKDYNADILNDLFVYDSDKIVQRINFIKECLPDGVQADKLYIAVIINFFERGRNISFNGMISNHISLKPFQLKCIAINEKDNNNFLLHFIRSKKNISFFPSPFTNDYNYISYFVSNDYSFYFSDDYSNYGSNVYMGLDGAVDYTNKALKKEDRRLLEYPDSNYLKEVILNDEYRKIYCPTGKDDFELVVVFKSVNIWITSYKANTINELYAIYSIIDMLSYWLGELKCVIDNFIFSYDALIIKNELKGNFDCYNADFECHTPISESIDIIVLDNFSLKIIWTPELFFNVCCRKNEGEKELIKLILNKLNQLSMADHAEYCLDSYFTSPSKYRLFSLDCQTYPYLKPTINRDFRKLPKEIVDAVLDEIGQSFINKGYTPGQIGFDDVPSTCNEIVSFLYERLKEEVSKYKIDNLIMIVYSDLECIMFNSMLYQVQYSSLLSCFPEKRAKFDDNYKELNQSSIAMKFLIEYIGSIQTNGDALIGELDYEYILVLCSEIIDWAQNSDLYKYGIINEKMSFLKSGRIGFNKKGINYLSQTNLSANYKRLIISSDSSLNRFSPYNSYSHMLPEIDEAYIQECQYSFTDYNNVIMAMIDLGEDIRQEIKQLDYDDLILRIENNTKLKKETIIKIINDSTIMRRDDFMKVPSPFKTSDVYPWRHNRRLSFVRRPLIEYNHNIIWGNRQLYHSLRYTFDLITNGRFEAHTLKMKQLISKIANSIGDNFNYCVYERIKSAGFNIIDVKVKKINKLKIEDDNKNTLGDIDVLLINISKKKIVVMEVKDFAFSRTPYEINREYMSIFCDSDGKLCYISKHKRRVEWVKSHINDVIVQYNLPTGKWKVSDALIVNEPIISDSYYHKNQKILLFSELDYKTINNL